MGSFWNASTVSMRQDLSLPVSPWECVSHGSAVGMWKHMDNDECPHYPVIASPDLSVRGNLPQFWRWLRRPDFVATPRNDNHILGFGRWHLGFWICLGFGSIWIWDLTLDIPLPPSKGDFIGRGGHPRRPFVIPRRSFVIPGRSFVIPRLDRGIQGWRGDGNNSIRMNS